MGVLGDGAPTFEAFACLWAVGMFTYSREITTAVSRHVRLIHATVPETAGRLRVAGFMVPSMEMQIDHEVAHCNLEFEPVNIPPEVNEEDLGKLVSAGWTQRDGAYESEASRKDRAQHNKAVARQG